MKLQKSFNLLHQRIFYNYLLCLSPFKPVKSDLADEQAQEQLHRFCGVVLCSAFENPELLGLKAQPDDCFELYVCNNRKPELSKSFRRYGELTESFYRFLCYAALNGTISGSTLTVALDKQQMKAAKEALAFLPYLGFGVVKDSLSVTLTASKYPRIFPAMRLLASVNAPGGEITGKTLFSFAMCVFSGDIDYLIPMIERKMDLESGFFAPYFERMLGMGYRFERDWGWGAEGPYFSFQFNNGVSGVHICFQIHKKHQIYFQLGSQIGVKAICEDFDSQPAHIQDYLLDRLSDCNNCLGCTKGGRNAKFAVEVDENGAKCLLCPNSFWIGFQIEYMNHDVMRTLIDFSALQEQYGENWRKKK